MATCRNSNQVDSGPPNFEWNEMKREMDTMILQTSNLTNVVTDNRDPLHRCSSIGRARENPDLSVPIWRSTDNHNVIQQSAQSTYLCFLEGS